MTEFSVVVRANGIDLDKCKVALPLEIVHGRSNVDTQPDAPTCTFTYIDSIQPGVLGDSIEVEVAGVADGEWADPDAQWTDIAMSWLGIRGRSLRFRGFISSLKAIEVEGQVVAWDVEATGDQARLGRVTLDITRPQETDVARVQAIADAAGFSIEVIGTPGPTLIADAINRDALDAIHEVCKSSGGVLWQQRDGTLTYGTMYRADFLPQRIISCSVVLDGIEWSRDAKNVINHVTVQYGSPSSARFQTGEWRLDTSTTVADPGAGQLRLNGTDAETSTVMCISQMTWDGIDGTLVLSALKPNATITGQQKDDATKWARWRVSGAPIDRGGWWEVPLQHIVDGDGGSVAKNKQVLIDFGLQSQQEQDTYRDDDSIAEWGYWHVDVSTMCASSTDAALLATAMLGRRKQPRWVMPGVVVLRNEATDAQWSQIATLDFGFTAFLDVEETPTPTPGQNTPWTVEGWVETWESEGRRVQLALSEYRLGVPITWATADDQTWDYWRSNHSWLTAMVEV